ncbi:LAETG motif-containing sortase-dependent surface protein [Streptomyces sp. NPDC093544]|uniref:LAETG motif-containing sortase-dependent surface protein n=1 Tax=Streptomyces sp. NPDC093544 TaxID=3155200 RepID=UPI0034270416
MSIARRVTLRCLLGTGAVALALSASTTGAWATGTPGGDGWDKTGSDYKPGKGAGTKTETDRCQFSLDGTNFYDSVRVDDQTLKPTDDGKVHIKVRTAGDAATCTASLASYRAHGATFNTSGEQVFHDFDTVTVKPGGTDSLDIAVPDVGCFAQVDLYRGAVKFDGDFDANDGFEHGDLPKGPDRPVIKDKLIAAWNGGTKDCTTQQPSTPATPPASTPPASTPAASSPPASTPATPTEPAPAESTTSATPSESESTTPAAPSPNGGGSTAPGDLAETGGGNTLPIAAGAAALLAAGAAITVVTRRRRAPGTRA